MKGRKTKRGHFLYLDPPYWSERSRLYLGRIEHDDFCGWLKKQCAGWALSMNGPDADSDSKDFVSQIYDERFELPNGNSAVRRLSGRETPSVTGALIVQANIDTGIEAERMIALARLDDCNVDDCSSFRFSGRLLIRNEGTRLERPNLFRPQAQTKSQNP